MPSYRTARSTNVRRRAPGRRAPTEPRRGFVGAVVAAALVALGAGCAGPSSERNLAPLFSSHSAAGGVPEVEALGGVLVTRLDTETGKRRYWAVRPIISRRYRENGDRFSWFIPPLGYSKTDVSQGASVSQLIPLARYSKRVEPSGFVTWSLLVLPGIYWAAHEDGRIQRAFFPFGGVVEKFLSLDRGTFVLFPFWLRIERYGRTTDHVIWPFFSYSRGGGGTAWRAWPLIGNNRWEGRYSRWFFLWPFFHWQVNDVQYGEDEQQRSWLVWPLVGQTRRNRSLNTTLLWPFFGYASDKETGFWAWDGPWPIVVFQGGDPGRATRRRVWPFYSYYRGDGLTSRWVLWPIVNWRDEIYDDGVKDTFKIFPLWRSHTRVRDHITAESTGPLGTERYRKAWPFGKSKTAPGVSELDIIDLNPFADYQFVDEHYSWLWELYTRHAHGDEVRSRSWLGLWRQEKDADEDRRSLSVLWSARDYTRAGRMAHERSFLFGLVRYRSVDDGGFTMLRPAFPGPGWPMRRTPTSFAPPVAVSASSTSIATSLAPSAAAEAGDSPRLQPDSTRAR